MKTQVEYNSNIDYQATYEKFSTSPFPTDQNSKGIITVYVKRSTVNISPYGKVQVTSPNAKEKIHVLRLVRPYLVPIQGQKLWLKPYKTHFHSPWPPPEEFEFSACKTVFRYVRVHEPFIITLLPCLIISIAGFLILRDLTPNAVQSVNVAWNTTALEKHLAIQLLNIIPYVVAILAVFFSFAILLEAKRLVKNKLKNIFLCLKFW